MLNTLQEYQQIVIDVIYLHKYVLLTSEQFDRKIHETEDFKICYCFKLLK